MLKSAEYTKWLSVVALLMFVCATFQIVDGYWGYAALCFDVAASFMAISTKHGKLEKDGEQPRQ